MVDRDSFEAGLQDLADALGARLTPGRLDALYKLLSEEFTAESWAAVVKAAALECDRFPQPKVLLALRGGSIERHECTLCEDSPGWIATGWVRTKPSYDGTQVSRKRETMQPCPRRHDARAAEFYANKAERDHMEIGEAREQAEARARFFSQEIAAKLNDVLDVGKIGSAGQRS